MTVVKSFLILISLLTLAACGGGGESSNSASKQNSNGGNTSTAATLTLVSSPAIQTLTEYETVALSFTLQGVEGTLNATMEYDYLPENSAFETIVNGSTITINIDVGNELMYDAVSNLTVTIEDDRNSANQTVSWSEQLNIVNTSGDAKHDRYIALKGAAQSYALLLPEQKLVERLVTLSVFVNPESTSSTRKSLINQVEDIINDVDYATALSDAIAILDETTLKYIASEIDEYELTDMQTTLDNAMSNYSLAIHSVIQNAIAETMGEVAGYEHQGAIPSATGEQLSSFIGNTSIGAYENGQWVFSDEYAFLEPIAFPELETCSVE